MRYPLAVSDDVKLLLVIIADAGMLLLAASYLLWRRAKRGNGHAGANGSLNIREAVSITYLLLALAIIAWFAALIPVNVKAQISLSNEAAHARFEERTASVEKRLSRLENLPEAVALQAAEQKRMREQISELKESVNELIAVQRNLFIGILLTVVGAAVQLLDRWAFAARKARQE